MGVTFLWVGVGWCDLFLGRCGLVWVGVTFLCVSVGWCVSVWVGAQNDITVFLSYCYFSRCINKLSSTYEYDLI